MWEKWFSEKLNHFPVTKPAAAIAAAKRKAKLKPLRFNATTLMRSKLAGSPLE